MNDLFDRANPSVGFPALSKLPWAANRISAHAAAYEILMAEHNLPATLKSWLESLSKEELDIIIERSVERASHYKWYLGGSREAYLVWLHQYKPPAQFQATNRFAASVHNHRLGFSSRVICGTLQVTWYQAELIGDRARLVPLDRRRLTPGTVIHMKPDEIHGIDRVNENTCTLVIQGPAERHFSTVFNVATGEMERQEDLDALYPRLVEVLRIATSRGDSDLDVNP